MCNPVLTLMMKTHLPSRLAFVKRLRS